MDNKKKLKIYFIACLVLTIVSNVMCWCLHTQMECKDEHIYFLHEDWSR